jgi:xylan 1,4-beta-xylosidase
MLPIQFTYHNSITPGFHIHNRLVYNKGTSLSAKNFPKGIPMNTIDVHQEINLSLTGQPFNRFALEGVGSCHAYLTLREDWREHARLIQQEIGFKSVRTHGIFHDLVGIYSSWPEPHLNFQNLNKIYDFWLSQGLKPYVELSFMPEALASGSQTCFVYRANVTPPRQQTSWNAMIHAMVSHLIDRYGLKEVLTWNFEVWNEPDLNYFWGGSMQDYLQLYAGTAQTIKAIHPKLKVGGPATSKSLWVPEMLDFCTSQNVPIDFISTHHYCADAALEMGVFTNDIRWRGQKAMRADVQRVVDTVRRSAMPGLEVHYTEWNVSPIHADRFGKDSEFTAAFVLQTIKDVEGLVDRYMLWAISDIFEESGPGEAPFSGKYGLVNLHGIKKPVYHAFRFLSRLYNEMLLSGSSSYVTRSETGSLRVLSWNFNEPLQIDFHGGDFLLDESEKTETFRLAPLSGPHHVRGWRVNRSDGNAYRAWQAMGEPQYPTTAQIKTLQDRSEAVLFMDERVECDGELCLSHTLPPSGLVYYEVEEV